MANGHEKSNRLLIAQTQYLFFAKNYKNWLMTVETIASQICVICGI